MKKISILMALLAFCSISAFSVNVTPLTNEQVINLYDGPAPGMEGVKDEEYSIQDGTILLGVVKPTLKVFLPEPSVRKNVAMVVCPGGGMCLLSYKEEGEDVARALAKQGITAFVLKYRLEPIYNDKGRRASNFGEVMMAVVKQFDKSKEAFAKDHPGKLPLTSILCQNVPASKYAFADATKAMQLVRSHAHEWQFDKVGIMGFSAGAVTTTYIMLNHDDSSRPDFAGVIYGGWDVPQVPADACPLYMCSPVNDAFQPVETQNLFNAWREAKKPVELHYYQKAVHGYGVKTTGAAVDLWFDSMIAFMKDTKFLPK